MTYKLIQGDNRETLKTIPDNTIDSIVTDPPYGIDFLGKSWDADTGALETYQECLRVLKPGGHILAFSAARTYHHLAMTLERAGFEIRDQIMWIYSSGFPKSQDIGRSIDRAAGKKDPSYGTTNNNGTAGGINLSFTEDHIGGSRRCNKYKKDVAAQYDCKEDECGLKYNAQTEEGKKWLGWGTALKPAHEPICLARKPLKLSIARNVQEWGVGALNIDATRVGDQPIKTIIKRSEDNSRWYKHSQENENIPKVFAEEINQGRFPSNVIGEIAEPYQKYFYCPKVSRAERHIGLDLPPAMFGNVQGCYDSNGESFAVGLDARTGGEIATEASMLADMQGYYIDNQGNQQNIAGKQVWLPQTGNIYVHGLKEEYRKWCLGNGKTPNVGNNHPTVKPVELMRYLIKLITPPGGTVLDPYNGSGSTGMAAVELGFDYIGCELDPNYVAISHKRISSWRNNERFDSLFDWGDDE